MSNGPGEVPTRFGRYKILSKLGKGGMAVVYLAEDTLLRRQVALKVPNFTEGESPIVVERFYREARTAASLTHPNLCPVYDVGQISGFHYLTMPVIEGETLEKKVQSNGPLSPEAAVDIVRQLAQALQVLHDLSIVHRDLKPANVMIRTSGEPVLMDFGLARNYEAESQRLTATGAWVGTPAYMSPEQIQDPRSVGPTTDIYSLGVILFEATTGKLPFQGNPFAVVGQILHNPPPPPSTLRPGLPAALDTLCVKALAKKPEQRYPTMKAFALALEQLLQQLRPAASGPAGETQSLECPNCKRRLRLPAQSRGKRLKCPACQTLFSPNLSRPSPATVSNDVGETTAPQGLTPARVPALGRNPLELEVAPASTAPSPPPTFPPVQSVPAPAVAARPAPPRPVAPAPAPPTQPEMRLLPRELTNSLGLRMTLILPGRFLMGSPEGEAERFPHEGPRHEVEISYAFYIGTVPVTQQEYERVMGVNPSHFSASGPGREAVRGLETRRFPVDRVSWEDAMQFCQRLSALPLERAARRTYRLPTEAEWEYACRAGTLTPFAFGEVLSSTQANFDGSRGRGPNLRRPTPVGSYPPNAWGLYDLHGNVNEWSLDWFDPGYYRVSPRQNPPGPRTGQERVLRGGSWADAAAFLRAAYRLRSLSSSRDLTFGFRVVCVVA